MKPTLPFALALLAATAVAQSPATFTDPANLRGERVSPRTGRELPVDQGALGLQQLLRKLNTRASILNIVAHPDDEDGGMMAYYSRGMGARVADMSLTRGEGGQNAMTGDFEDALGLLRTQELLSNDRYVGVDQFFGTEVDFGFSKTKQESFSKWTHDRVLYDVVRVIRLYRPLVLTSTWIGGVTDGHGQHQVSGQIAQEAFVAAGDPKVFPELTAEGILPWQPLRIYARVPMQSISPRGLYDYATGQYIPAKFTNYVTGEVTTTPPTTDVTIHEGNLDPLLGDDTGPLSYVQFARKGLSQQKSQIGPHDRTASTGAYDVAYHLYGSRICNDANSPSNTQSLILSGAKDLCTSPVAATSPKDSATDPAFFAGIDTSILSLQEYRTVPTDILPRLASDIDSATKTFDPAHPEAIAPTLADALKITDELIQFSEKSDSTPIERANALHELRIKRVQLSEALALSLGVSLDATTISEDGNLLLDQPAKVDISIAKQSPVDVDLNMVRWLDTNFHGNLGYSLSGIPPHLISPTTHYALTASFKGIATIERPYFHRPTIEQPLYDLETPALRNAPASPHSLAVVATLNYNGASFDVMGLVHDGPKAVSFVPTRNVSLSSHAQVVSRFSPKFDIAVSDISDADRGSFTFSTQSVVFAQTARFNNMQFVFEGTLPHDATQPFTVSALPKTAPDGAPLEGFRPVGYGDLPTTNYYTPATDRIVPADLKLPSKTRIGYLPGTGDPVPEALASIGLKPTILTVDDLTPTKLAAFDTVILGVRTYAAHSDLHGVPTQALLDYARNGGNVVVQYQTHEFTAADAPYPLTMDGNGEKVVDETAPVSLLTSDEPLLNQPNKLSSADFNGWVEERGHGFLATWDAHYTAPTETHDPGAPAESVQTQSPQRGGLITTPLGKGRWTYVAFALYRQLPEAVPGAYRLFVNLLEP